MSGTRRTAKGQRTRERILDAALALFREQGYEATTVRQIAERAGVSIGNAYYYFESKEHLVQGFYARTHEEHLAACEPLLERERDLRARLRAVLVTKVETAEPYHGLAGVLFRSAADPASPLNPFSGQSAAVRDEAVELLRRVVEGSETKVHADFRSELPELLWLFEMSIILFWIHDESEGRARTLRLIDNATALVVRLIGMAGLPLLGSVRRQITGLLADLRPEDIEAAARAVEGEA